MNGRACLSIALIVICLAGCAAPRAGRPSAAGEPPGQPNAPSAAAMAAPSEGEPAPRPAERLVLALPAVTGVFAPHVLARDRGFFREEGFEVEFPLMRANLVVTALTSGEADYDGMIGPSIPAILAGQPHRVIGAVVVKSTRELMAPPEYTAIDQLRGKAIGVNSIGGGPYNSGQIAFQAYGFDPQRDVTWLQVGGTQERLAALQQGGIQGSIFSGSEVPLARALGFPSILRLDEVAPLPESGLTTTSARIESNRDQVKRVLHVIVRALQFMKSDREGSLPTFMDYLGLSREEAYQAYDAMAFAYGSDGTIPERTLRFAIDAEKEPMGITEDVPFARVADFGPLHELLADMQITPAPGSAR